MECPITGEYCRGWQLALRLSTPEFPIEELHREELRQSTVRNSRECFSCEQAYGYFLGEDEIDAYFDLLTRGNRQTHGHSPSPERERC